MFPFQAGCAGQGGFRHLEGASHLSDVEGTKVRFADVAVILLELLLPGWQRGASLLIVTSRLPGYLLAGGEKLTLSLDLELQSSFDVLQPVDVLDLHTLLAHRDVGIRPHRGLVLCREADKVAEFDEQVGEECPCLFRRRQVRGGDDLDQWHAGPVIVDEGDLLSSATGTLYTTGVLLDVDLPYADPAPPDGEVAIPPQGVSYWVIWKFLTRSG